MMVVEMKGTHDFHKGYKKGDKYLAERIEYKNGNVKTETTYNPPTVKFTSPKIILYRGFYDEPRDKIELNARDVDHIESKEIDELNMSDEGKKKLKERKKQNGENDGN